MSDAATTKSVHNRAISGRFRGYLPVVVDVETGGFNHETDALLEIAAVIIAMRDDGRLFCAEEFHAHVEPFEGSNIEPKSLEITGIDLDHPFRLAVDERDALKKIFKPIRAALGATSCQRAIMVAHNPTLDMNFVHAAAARANLKRNPFHPFSSFDTATLGGLAYGQTVLARAVSASGLNWQPGEAHSALYDAQMTARLFCRIANRWNDLSLLAEEEFQN